MNSPYIADPTGTCTNCYWQDTNEGNFAGSGSPEGVVVGQPGDTYANTANGDFWVKQTGDSTNTGWVLQTVGGGVPFTFTVGNGPPVGDPGVAAAGYFDKTAGQVSWWNDDLGEWQ